MRTNISIVFDYLEEDLANTPEGTELYFTDTLTRLAKEKGLIAQDFDGIRYDMGNKLGIMKANCEVALKHPEISEDFKSYIKELAKNCGRCDIYTNEIEPMVFKLASTLERTMFEYDETKTNEFRKMFGFSGLLEDKARTKTPYYYKFNIFEDDIA